MIIRKYEEKDINKMIEIWNEVVEDGIAFPQEDLLDDVSGREFLNRRVILESLKTMDRLLVYIFCIPIMSADAGISVMQVMQ